MSHNLDCVLKAQEDLFISRKAPKKDSIWRHYKGDLYIVKSLVMRESSESFDVVYTRLGMDMLYPWSRPMEEWFEIVNHEGKSVQRFELTDF